MRLRESREGSVSFSLPAESKEPGAAGTTPGSGFYFRAALGARVALQQSPILRHGTLTPIPITPTTQPSDDAHGHNLNTGSSGNATVATSGRVFMERASVCDHQGGETSKPQITLRVMTGWMRLGRAANHQSGRGYHTPCDDRLDAPAYRHQVHFSGFVLLSETLPSRVKCNRAVLGQGMFATRRDDPTSVLTSSKRDCGRLEDGISAPPGRVRYGRANAQTPEGRDESRPDKPGLKSGLRPEIDNRRTYLGYFVAWCLERGIERRCEVSRATTERYQRHLFHHRKEERRRPQHPLPAQPPGPRPRRLQMAHPAEPHPPQPGQRDRPAQARRICQNNAHGGKTS